MVPKRRARRAAALAALAAPFALAACGGASPSSTVAMAPNCVRVTTSTEDPFFGSGTATLVGTGSGVTSICSSRAQATPRPGTSVTYQVDGPVPSGTPVCTYADTAHPGVRWAVYPGDGDLAPVLCRLAQATGPTADEVARWPAQWCTVQIGMTRQQVYAIMGKPTSEFGPQTPTPQATWSADDDMFTAFFDAADHVRQLDVDVLLMTKAERAALTCAPSRR